MRDEYLTLQAARRNSLLGTEVSSESLASFIRKCIRNDADDDEIRLFAFLEEELLEAYVMSAGAFRLPHQRLLEDFFLTGNAALSVRRLAKHKTEPVHISPRTARDWVLKFAMFVHGVLQVRSKADAIFDVADVQCAESCGRKSQPSPSFGPKKWNNREKTPQMQRVESSGCADCPRRRG